MEDILASIRRILDEEETGQPVIAGGAAMPEAASDHIQPPAGEDVLQLDPSMMVQHQPPPQAEAGHADAAHPIGQGPLLAPDKAASVSEAVSGLVRTLAADRGTATSRTGPTIEDLVREELRPLLKTWLDNHLPALVERLVRLEIERVVGRAVF